MHGERNTFRGSGSRPSSPAWGGEQQPVRYREKTSADPSGPPTLPPDPASSACDPFWNASPFRLLWWSKGCRLKEAMPGCGTASFGVQTPSQAPTVLWHHDGLLQGLREPSSTVVA